MTYDLYIGDRTFSSWSLRGWLMLEKFDLPYRTHLLGLYAGTLACDLADLAPARLVPVLKTPEGHVIGETIAIAETLAERHPELHMWPERPAARACARWISAEMATSFSALRNGCPMQLQRVNQGFVGSDALIADLERIEVLWAYARSFSDANGPWLFGSYSLADAFFAPVAARIVGYDLAVSDAAREYCMTTIQDDAFRTWRSEGQKAIGPQRYELGASSRPWPVD